MKNFIYSASNALNRGSKKIEESLETKPHEKDDCHKSLLEMVTDYGYPIEKHFYETEDHYINCVHRISGPRGTKAVDNWSKKRPVIIYQHGFLDSAALVCIDGLDSLAFMLADLGYDVWMNNTRGNRFSRQHLFYDPGIHKEFWNYSF